MDYIHILKSKCKSLSKLKKLTHLDLSCNQISSLSSLYNLENLEWIEIPGNNVKDLSPLKRLRKLKTFRKTLKIF